MSDNIDGFETTGDIKFDQLFTRIEELKARMDTIEIELRKEMESTRYEVNKLVQGELARFSAKLRQTHKPSQSGGDIE